MTDRWRCFVAVPLDDALRSALADAVDSWRREPPADGMRWSDPQGWHLTLAFLGYIPADSVGEAARAIGDVAAAHRTFGVETGRLGAFHRPGSTRTLWYGVADTDGTLAGLGDDLARALGLAIGEPYRPHFTLARARRGLVDLRGWIERASFAFPSGKLDVAALRLLRSHLGDGPARYETLACFVIGGAP